MGGLYIPPNRTEVWTEFDSLHAVSAGAGWVDWDLSASVGVNKKVMILCRASNAAFTIGVREKGSANDRRYAANTIGQNLTLDCKTDSSGIIQCYDAGATCTYVLISSLG